MRRVLPFCGVLFAVVAVLGQSNSWRGLTPLVSTRTEVEKLLGPPKKDVFGRDTFSTDKDDLEVIYVGPRCSSGWDVSEDKVFSITTSPKSRGPTNFDDLKLDKSKFSYTIDDAMFATWTDPNAGIQYYFGNFDQEFREGRFIPKRTDNHLRCNGFPPYAPEGVHYPFETIDFYDADRERRDGPNEWFAHFENFLISFKRGYKAMGYKGYAVVYTDRKLTQAAYKRRLARLQRYLFVTREYSREDITFIEGGLRGKSEVQLFILPAEYKPPAPAPTLPSPQFMRRK